MSAPATPKPAKSILANPMVRSLVLVALLGEIAFATMNLSTMPVYLKFDRMIGESVIGLITVAFLLSEAIFKGPMGHLADRYGPKTLMLAGPCISACTAALTLVIPHNLGALEVGAFMVLRLLDGLASAMLWPALFLAMGEAVSDADRQQGMSYLNLCYMLGIALAFPIGGVANDLAGVKWAGLVLAAVLFTAVAICVWRMIPGKKSSKHAILEEHGDFDLRDLIRSMKQIPTYLILSLVTFGGIGFPLVIFKLFPKDQFRWTESQIGLIILPGAITLAALSVPMAKYGDRLGRIKAVHVGMLMCVVGLWLIAAGMFVPLLRQWWILAFAAIPIGVGFLLAIPSWMASVSDIDPKRRGANVGAIMTAQGIGAIIGAPVGATMYEKLVPLGNRIGLGNGFAYYSPFFGCAVCVTLGWLLSLRILREPKPSLELGATTEEGRGSLK